MTARLYDTFAIDPRCDFTRYHKLPGNQLCLTIIIDVASENGITFNRLPRNSELQLLSK